MPIDDEAQAVFDYITERETTPLPEMSPEEARRFEGLPLASGPEVFRAQDRRIPGPAGEIPIRVYTPGPGDSLPVLVWLHGGGWVLGNLDSEDAAKTMSWTTLQEEGHEPIVSSARLLHYFVTDLQLHLGTWYDEYSNAGHYAKLGPVLRHRHVREEPSD